MQSLRDRNTKERSDPHRTVPSVSRTPVSSSRSFSSDLLVPPAALQVSPDTFASSFSELRELPCAGVDDGLDLLFRLLADGYYPIEVLVDEETDEHLDF